MKIFKIIIGFLLAAGMTALTLDQSASVWFDLPEHKSWQRFAFSITDIGKAEQWFILAILVYVVCKFLKTRAEASDLRARLSNLQNWSVHLFWGLSISGLILHLIKFLFGRQRPHMSPTREPLVFHPFNVNWDYQSFASGHTQTLFCVGFFFSLLWPRFSAVFWLAAATVALTRVMALEHFVSDVIIGALIGVYGAKLSLYLVSKRTLKPLAFKADSPGISKRSN